MPKTPLRLSRYLQFGILFVAVLALTALYICGLDSYYKLLLTLLLLSVVFFERPLARMRAINAISFEPGGKGWLLWV
ncbi:MAG: hypothetical protein KDI30_00685, partial [Pseudomonadales bacterium]|nr:hypothetical protein [Pseudomonadales bacterium]